MTDQPYGPNHDAVAAHIERVKTLTLEQMKMLSAARAAARAAALDERAAAWDEWDAAWNATWEAAWYALRDALREAWDATQGEAWDEWDATWGARDAARDAMLALFARHLITEEQFDLLYGPWASVMEQEASNE